MGITKTDFMRGMQCRKMLWLDKHKPKLRVIPPEIQKRLDAGNDFGDRAMAMFGDYEEMTVYRPGTQILDTKAMAAKTAEHLERGTPVICEAAFIYYNNYCAVDILRKTDTGYDFYEVKNAPAVYDQFVRDAGFQYYLLNRCKLKIGSIFAGRYKVLEHMGRWFGDNISLRRSPAGKGTMTVRFNSDEEMERFLNALDQNNL